MNQNLYQKQQQAPAQPSSEKPTEGMGMLIGQNVAVLEKELGKPQRIDDSLYDYQWYIYNKDYGKYVQVGVENNQVVTVFAIGDKVNVAPLEIGQPVEEIFNTQYIDTNLNINLNGNSYQFELNDTDLNLRPIVQLGDVYAQLYIDRFSGYLSAVRFLNAETLIKQRPYELVYKGNVTAAPEPDSAKWNMIEQGTELEVFDITNVMRKKNKVKAVAWDDQAAEAAFEHSKEMAVNNDLSHDSKQSGSLQDRLKNAKVTYQTAGENIAANYTDGPAVVEGWLNSKVHRDTLLSKEFTHLGVGVYQKYFTQNFIQKAAK